MAGIDKTYTSSFKDYLQFKEWAKNKRVVFNYGRKTISKNVCDFIYEWEEHHFDGTERPILNTPTWIDKYLYDNCPCEFVMDRLKEVYQEGYLDGLNIGKLPDEFKMSRKVSIISSEYTSLPLTNKGLSPKTKWWLQIKDYNFGYSDDLDAWVDRELFPTYSNTMHFDTLKSMIRRLRKMYLPKGIEFRLTGRYIGEDYTVKIS